MSNENFKHHENREKVEGGLTCTFQGTLFLILLCELNGPVEFKNHMFVRLCHENYVHLTLQTMYIFDKKPQKIGIRAIMLQTCICMCRVNIFFAIFVFIISEGKNYTPMSPPCIPSCQNALQCHPHPPRSFKISKSTGPLGSMSPSPRSNEYVTPIPRSSQSQRDRWVQY